LNRPLNYRQHVCPADKTAFTGIGCRQVQVERRDPTGIDKADKSVLVQQKSAELPVLAGYFVSIQLVFGKAPKVWCFKNLGSQGWLLRAPGWIHAFLETPRLWAGLC
jgi:hypothetical protein